jgi:hypothetical protein
MPTQQSAFLCALAAICLISCNTKTTTPGPTRISEILPYDSVQALPDAPLETGVYNDAFLDNAVQRFTAGSRKVSVITAKKGLKITLDPSILEKEDGSVVDGRVDVNIIELTSSNDLFKSNAATISDGRLLASGGSYYVGMFCNGQKLRIKRGKKLQVDFPRLSENEMQLFYGERNAGNDMNWKWAGTTLEPQAETLSFTDTNSNFTDLSPYTFFKVREDQHYRSLKDEVYLYTKKMTLGELIDTLNKPYKRVYVDSIYAWPRNVRPDLQQDTNFLLTNYGPRYQLRIRTIKTMQADCAEAKKRDSIRKAELEKWQPQNLAGQLQKYYAPSMISQLGWLNCDRFYQYEKTGVDLDFPVSLNKCTIQYFVIFRGFSGLLSERLELNGNNTASISNLPVGEQVTLVAFTKSNGVIYQGKEDFTVQKNKKLPMEFKAISKEELAVIFRNNVKA